LERTDKLADRIRLEPSTLKLKGNRTDGMVGPATIIGPPL
jgi:hypothetical protein